MAHWPHGKKKREHPFHFQEGARTLTRLSELCLKRPEEGNDHGLCWTCRSPMSLPDDPRWWRGGEVMLQLIPKSTPVDFPPGAVTLLVTVLSGTQRIGAPKALYTNIHKHWGSLQRTAECFPAGPPPCIHWTGLGRPFVTLVWHLFPKRMKTWV